MNERSGESIHLANTIALLRPVGSEVELCAELKLAAAGGIRDIAEAAAAER